MKLEEMKMAEWNLYGSERREIFEESIKPESLFYTLQQYQKTFGKTFGIVELLELENSCNGAYCTSN